ncbi:cytochrome c biogenesis protein ResB [Engelhardtia mirabilis]|uniref:Cytochrome c biogenesis protein Ccs1 n=1 Tax=Engelhardtia mirabilis TaxID=2528011 RepID=A0A518BN90_9BACT|nr:Cytochrome c biogenesis protein Ccs1 [Planctomycetes bacterium Pla133]QDV02752.1 Cytochrome c biogenesis protein Ccs1 [Planctomycetes bacterium Pla86]
MKVLSSGSARLVAVLSSISLAGVLICLLALLTFLGTLEQAEHGLYEVQKRYFESSYLIHEAGGVPIPLPGGGLVMGLLFVNLILGGVVRLRRGAGTAGVLVAHLGMVLMLVAGFVKYATGEEGHVTLYEGDTAAWFQSYTETELAVISVDPAGRHTERILPGDSLRGATSAAPVVASGLPFRLEVTHWFDNANVSPKGPMFDVDVPVVDGFFLRAEPLSPQAERNGPGAYVAVTGADGRRQVGLLWAYDAAPWTVDVGGARFVLDLRRQRFPMPFEVRLDEFTKEDHPGTNMPAWFSSDVSVDDGSGERPVTISMNRPLREAGLVLYQASWGPGNARPGDRLFSTLAVVRNPADQWPLYSCLVIAGGLLFHFGRKLARHVRREVAR